MIKEDIFFVTALIARYKIGRKPSHAWVVLEI